MSFFCLDVITNKSYKLLENDEGEENKGVFYEIETNQGFIKNYSIKNYFEILHIEQGDIFLSCEEFNIQIFSNSNQNLFIKVALETEIQDTFEEAYFQIFINTSRMKLKTFFDLQNYYQNFYQKNEQVNYDLPYKLYKGFPYLNRKGKRGGEYIIVDNKKVYV